MCGWFLSAELNFLICVMRFPTFLQTVEKEKKTFSEQYVTEERKEEIKALADSENVCRGVQPDSFTFFFCFFVSNCVAFA